MFHNVTWKEINQCLSQLSTSHINAFFVWGVFFLVECNLVPLYIYIYIYIYLWHTVLGTLVMVMGGGGGGG